MIFDLNNILDRERFKRRANSLYEKRVVVTLTEKQQRTLHQNNYLHLILGFFACETGNTIEYVKREYFKRYCNKDLFVYVKKDVFLKTDIQELRSTRDLSKEEMSIAIDRFRNWAAAEGGIHLPSPDEREFLKAIEIELSKHQNYI